MTIRKIFTLIFLLASVVACTKSEDAKKNEPFVEGQTVIISASIPSTKVAGNLNKTTGYVSFTWEDGDQIKVGVSPKSGGEKKYAVFDLISGAGTDKATFQGEMPADGDTYDVQFPVDEVDLSEQNYSVDALPHNMMKATASNLTIGEDFTLNPEFSAIRFDFWGDKTIGRIVVTDKTTSGNPSYALKINDGVTLDKDKTNPTSFLIVLPPMESKNITVDIYAPGDILLRTLTPSSALTFSIGQVLNMPKKAIYDYIDEYGINHGLGTTIGSTSWAPVNCGYKNNNSGNGYVYGKLYQWGRKTGFGYSTDDETYATGAPTWNGANGSENPNYMYCSTAPTNGITYNYDWIYGGDNSFWNLGTEAEPEKNETYDPCPAGWRICTSKEIGDLQGGKTSYSIVSGTHGASTVSGTYFNGTSSADSGVFLPASGYRSHQDSSAGFRNSSGFYWTSKTVSGDYGVGRFQFHNNGVVNSMDLRADGFSVRCVQE